MTTGIGLYNDAMRLSLKSSIGFVLPVFILLSYSSCKSSAKNSEEEPEKISKADYQQLYLERKNEVTKTIEEKGIFYTSAEKTEFDRLKKRESWWGQPRYKKMDQKRKFGNSVIEQRSARMRLYDHNIFLRAVFAGKVEHKKFGSLKDMFQDAVFFDIGSAIMMFEGAPTVRDIYEDPDVMGNLKTVVASDINDPKSSKNRYVDDYYERIKKVPSYKFPFPVVEIPMAIDSVQKYHELTERFSKNDTPYIFRGANSGPDLYYDMKTTYNHLKNMSIAYADRNVMYFFNSLVLFKHKSMSRFQIIGVINPRVGFAHRGNPWRYIRWDRRKVTEAFFPRKQYITIHPAAI